LDVIEGEKAACGAGDKWGFGEKQKGYLQWLKPTVYEGLTPGLKPRPPKEGMCYANRGAE
jgi:hypothetical protein